MAPVYPRPIGAPPPRRSVGLPPSIDALPREERTPTPVRRFDVLYLDDQGRIEDLQTMAPAIDGFEAASGAFTHGTLIDTTDGQVAVEDLLPGMQVLTRDDGPQPLRWIGSMTLVPQSSDQRTTTARLTRVTEGSIGIGKPVRDLVLGPHARLLRRNAACLNLFGTESAFAPAHAFVDTVSIIEVHPVSSVRVFHLLLDGQHVITAGGLEVESYHPGRRDATGIPPTFMSTFLDLFPTISTLSDFGQMRVPRLSAEDIRALESA